MAMWRLVCYEPGRIVNTLTAKKDDYRYLERGASLLLRSESWLLLLLLLHPLLPPHCCSIRGYGGTAATQLQRCLRWARGTATQRPVAPKDTLEV